MLAANAHGTAGAAGKARGEIAAVSGSGVAEIGVSGRAVAEIPFISALGYAIYGVQVTKAGNILILHAAGRGIVGKYGCMLPPPVGSAAGWHDPDDLDALTAILAAA